MRNRFRVLLTAVCSIIIVFIALSFLALAVTRVFPGLYSETSFAVSFAVGGVLASALSFEYGMVTSEHRTAEDRWSLILVQVILGLGSFFLLSRLQQDEFEIPFKSFGLAMALGSLLHAGDRKRSKRY